MATTYTAQLALPSPAIGDSGWGVTENTARTLVDSAVAGIFSLPVYGSGFSGATGLGILTYNQGAVDQERNQHFSLTSASGALTAPALLLFPNGITKTFSVANNSTGSSASGINFTTTIGVNNGSGGLAGTGTVVPQGFSMNLVSDGTNVVPRGNAISSGIIDGTNVGLNTAASGSFTNLTTGNLTVSSGASGIFPSGSIIDFAGITSPAGWLLCYGQPVARTGATGFPSLFSAITISATGGISSGSSIIGGITPTTSGMVAGMPISGAGIPASTTVFSVDSSSQIHISQNATGGSGGSTGIVVAPFGVGDGVSTFNIPDFRGRTAFGVDNMGGIAAGRLTNPTAGAQGINGALPGAVGGEQAHTQTTAELVAHTHLAQAGGAYVIAPGPGDDGLAAAGAGGATWGFASATAPFGGGGAFNVVPPGIALNRIIKT